MAFRVFGLLALGVVFGFVLGGIKPRTDLAERDREIVLLKKRLERIDRPNPLRDLLPVFSPDRVRELEAEQQQADNAQAATAQNAGTSNGLAEGSARPQNAGEYTVIRGSEGQASSPSVAPTKPGTQPLAAEDNAAKQDAKTESSDQPRDRPRGFRALDLENFDRLAALQRVRMETSRAALIDQGKLNEKEVAEVDKSVKKMNDDLAGYGEEILVQASSEEPPSPSQALGLGHDVSGIMLDGQKRIEQILGPRSDGVDPEAMQIWNYIDIERLRPSAEKLLPAKAAAPAPTPEAAPTDPAQAQPSTTSEQKP